MGQMQIHMDIDKMLHIDGKKQLEIVNFLKDDYGLTGEALELAILYLNAQVSKHKDEGVAFKDMSDAEQLDLELKIKILKKKNPKLRGRALRRKIEQKFNIKINIKSVD